MIFEMIECGGCRTCELVCGYHHTGVFNPNKSSLKIVNRRDDQPGFLVEIKLFDDDIASGCDGCVNLEKPLCVSYCHQDLDLLEMIQSVLDEKCNKKSDLLNIKEN